MSEAREHLLSSLRKWKQEHILSSLNDTTKDPEWVSQFLRFESWYAGGIDKYLSTASQLFAEQQPSTSTDLNGKEEGNSGENWSEWVPSVPQAPLATLESPEYADLEALGLDKVHLSAFVIVAGGLGERLGFPGIKLKLPTSTITGHTYIQLYIEQILALQALVSQRRGEQIIIPLAIMTSDSTHVATKEFLDQNDNFGMTSSQLTLLKQDVVPCLDIVPDDNGDIQLQLVLNDDKTSAMMKPHGHGDVHTLLLSSGKAREWQEKYDKRFVHFLQDTNGLIFNSVLPLVGNAVRNSHACVFTAVQRKAKDASGGVVKFTNPKNEQESALFNVEYHELDQFLKEKGRGQFPEGDVNDPATGYSPFPGNINHIMVDLGPYLQVLQASKGLMPEVLNPKYKDASRKSLKSPARLECMMQDIPKLLLQFGQEKSTSPIPTTGVVQFPPELVYSPLKNDVASAQAKAQQDVPSQCATSAEHDLFATNKRKLEVVGVKFGPEGEHRKWLGIPVSCSGPHMLWSSTFNPAQSVLAQHFPTPSNIQISSRSTLIIEGDNITIKSLTLDGALVIRAAPGVELIIDGLDVINAGYEYESVDPNAADIDPVYAIRGYRFKCLETKTLEYTTPGTFTVTNERKELNSL